MQKFKAPTHQVSFPSDGLYTSVNSTPGMVIKERDPTVTKKKP